MIIECDQCYARYRYDEARFGGKPSKKVRCTKCLAIFEIFNTAAFESQPPALGFESPSPSASEETVGRLSEAAEKPADSTTAKRKLARAAAKPEGAPSLPEGYRVSLAVIAGPESGRIFEIDKPRVVIGRSDADIAIDDPEVSRQHAALEIYGDKVTLVDMGSTNGTLVDDEPVTEAALENQSEFSIGGSTLMLILTPKG
ncbi:MAG TPA: FHA domain-containing protein [Thermoanaerobaculia bacterium]|nr:FHA domain-containing protein [Thermoanaerobaculia bacterium]